MTDEMTTKPKIETVLDRINQLQERVDERVSTLDGRVDERINKLEEIVTTRIDRLQSEMIERFEKVYAEIDRVGSVAHSTKAEMLSLRVDFRELRLQLKETVPIPQPS